MEKIALSVTEAAIMLGVSRPTMYEITKKPDFDAAFKVGRRTLISAKRLQEWVDRQHENMWINK